MKDASGKILYVGKASDLRNRVRSYFQSSSGLTPKTQQLVAEVQALEFYITTSEQSALILENNLIKRYRPYYNIRLRDDKGYPYIRINLREDWPGVTFTRQLKNDGANYFGPFASPWSVRQTIKVLQSIFHFRTCAREITGTDKRPCLKYYLNHCPAPCTGLITRDEYREIIKQIILFLQGKEAAVVRELELRMKDAAEAESFEAAARFRDQIQAIKSVIEGQQIAATVSGEQDVVALATDRDQACVQVFFVRDGKLIGRESFNMAGTTAEAPEQIMTSFVKQFYSSATYIPLLLVLQYPIDDKEAIEGWLRKKRGGPISILVPQKGNRKKLVDIVAENARQGLEHEKIKRLAAPDALNDALQEIQQTVSLPHPPTRIEGYDVSNIQGKEAVGSMVVFENGKSRPSHYRRFRIKTVPGANDYAMLQEILRRRFKRGIASDTVPDDTWAILPDLLLIDGGKGQLNAGREVMKEVGLESLPIASLAKENEEIFIPRRQDGIILPRNAPGLQLLQRVRDEAHRFALAYHTGVRRKRTFASALDSIPGIGPRRKRALLAKFGSVRGIREASVEELQQVKGMNQALAESLKAMVG